MWSKIQDLKKDDYEIEFRISNDLELFKLVQSKFKQSANVFTDELITSYNSKDMFIRGEKNTNDKNGKIRYLSKEVIHKETFNTGVVAKICIEHKLKDEPIERQTGEYRKLRISYDLSKDFNFKLDMTVRMFSKVKPLDSIECDEHNVREAILIDNFTMNFDLEFESTRSYKDRNLIKDDYIKFYNELMKLKPFDICDKINAEITFDVKKCPQVSVLTNTIINNMTTSNDELYWLDKTDGVRRLIIIDSDNSIYSVHGVEGTEKIGETKNFKLTIFDTESVKNEYFIFDVYYYDGEDVRNKPFDERMTCIKKELPNCFKFKKYNKVNDWKKLIDYAMTEHKGFDGIVIQENWPYDISTPSSWLRVPYQFKLKPMKYNTIDFLYKYTKDKWYHLYLSGGIQQIIFNNRAMPRYLTDFDYNMKSLDPNERYYNILFSTPLFSDTSGYEFDPIDVKQLGLNEKDVTCLDNLIIETNYDIIMNKFRPIRIRLDKDHPNGYNVGLINMSLYFSPVKIDENIYFENITDEQVMKNYNLKSVDEAIRLIDEFHQINQDIRQLIFKRFGEQYNVKYHTCLDLAGGRGGDLLNILSLGINNVFAEDSDKEALVRYSLKAHKSRMLLNCFGLGIGKNNTLLINDIKSRREYKPFGLVVINYAIHYLIPVMKELRNFLRAVCKRNVYIIMTYYDGEMIKKCNGEFKTFKIKINSSGTSAEMPLPTISSTGYRTEPLVLKDSLNEYFKCLYEIYPFTEFGLKSEFCDDYLSCIKSGVYTLK